MLEVNRREFKYLVSPVQTAQIARRLERVMLPDPNNGADGYTVRSLYFDTLSDRDYTDKLNGYYQRRKIRLRSYGTDSTLKLELKEKQGDYQRKRSLLLTRPEAEQMQHGQYGFLLARPEPLAQQLYTRLVTECYRPRCLVVYRRTAYYLRENDTRVTFDSRVASSMTALDVFAYAPLCPAFCSGQQTMEVKYRGFLLSSVKAALGTDLGMNESLGKYNACRESWMH